MFIRGIQGELTCPTCELFESFRYMNEHCQVAVDYLVENMKNTLYLEKEESVPVYELLSVVAAQYNMTAEHYCEVTCISLNVSTTVGVPGGRARGGGGGGG